MLLNFQLLFQSNEHKCDNTQKYAQFYVYIVIEIQQRVFTLFFEYINTKKKREKCFVLSNSHYNVSEIKAIIKLFIST